MDIEYSDSYNGEYHRRNRRRLRSFSDDTEYDEPVIDAQQELDSKNAEISKMSFKINTLQNEVDTLRSQQNIKDDPSLIANNTVVANTEIENLINGVINNLGQPITPDTVVDRPNINVDKEIDSLLNDQQAKLDEMKAFQPFDSSIENLRWLAKESPVVAEALSLDSGTLFKIFQDPMFRYALLTTDEKHRGVTLAKFYEYIPNETRKQRYGGSISITGQTKRDIKNFFIGLPFVLVGGSFIFPAVSSFLESITHIHQTVFPFVGFGVAFIGSLKSLGARPTGIMNGAVVLAPAGMPKDYKSLIKDSGNKYDPINRFAIYEGNLYWDSYDSDGVKKSLIPILFDRNGVIKHGVTVRVDSAFIERVNV